MKKSLKILFISAECAPFAKRGGLGDVAGSLPKALAKLGHDVRVVMPAYRAIENGYPTVEVAPQTLNVPARHQHLPAGLFQSTLPDSPVPIYFIAERELFDREEVYGYDDDAYRFSFFSRAAIELCHVLDWTPDVVHAHDWHTAASIFWLATAGQTDARFAQTATVFTIHNLMHQGHTSWDLADYLEIQTHGMAEESYGELNLMARGILHAQAVTTVSPTYSQEIMTEAGGCGLDGLLRHRGMAVHGIVNGIDNAVWNPATDPRLPVHFSAEKLKPRLKVRHALQEMAGLPQIDDIPLVAMISRLDWQKGLDLTGEVVHRLLNNWAGEAQFIVLGTGSPEYEDMFRQLQGYHSEKMHAFLDYNAGLAPLIYGGSDMFVMPSRFEPCGLSQLLSMRYGSVPVVRATGGLVDTVRDEQTGFVFHDYSAESFWHALSRAIYVYNTDKQRWQAIQQAGMQSDFSWDRSAEIYSNLYKNLVDERS